MTLPLTVALTSADSFWNTFQTTSASTVLVVVLVWETLATFFGAAFLFGTGPFGVLFLAGAFLAGAFLAGTFLAGAFFAAAFLAGAFLSVFFFGVAITDTLVVKSHPWRN